MRSLLIAIADSAGRGCKGRFCCVRRTLREGRCRLRQHGADMTAAGAHATAAVRAKPVRRVVTADPIAGAASAQLTNPAPTCKTHALHRSRACRRWIPPPRRWPAGGRLRHKTVGHTCQMRQRRGATRGPPWLRWIPGENTQGRNSVRRGRYRVLARHRVGRYCGYQRDARDGSRHGQC